MPFVIAGVANQTGTGCSPSVVEFVLLVRIGVTHRRYPLIALRAFRSSERASICAHR
jgi:hypothetical protein